MVKSKKRGTTWKLFTEGSHREKVQVGVLNLSAYGWPCLIFYLQGLLQFIHVQIIRVDSFVLPGEIKIV